MNRGIYGSTLVRGEWKRALRINEVFYGPTYENYLSASRREDFSRAMCLSRVLHRTAEIANRIHFRLDAKKNLTNFGGEHERN